MRYRPLGRTGVQVSELALGTMTFGQGQPVTKVDPKGADAIVGRALDAGINLFDTADVYGDGSSEQLLGRALGGRRDDVLVASKVGFGPGPPTNRGGLSYRHVIDGCEASLRRLGTDRIDLLQIHRRDPRTPFDETARALDDLVRRGLVRYVGCSNLSAWVCATDVAHQRHHHLAAFCSAQMYYSLVGRGIEAEVVPCASTLELALLIYSPLAGGYLTGRYRDEGSQAGRRSTVAWPPLEEAVGGVVLGVLDEVAAGHETTPAAVALAWVLARPWVGSVLLGASSVSQLEANLAAVALALGDEDLRRLDEVSDVTRHWPYWWPEIFESGGNHRARLLAQAK